MVCFYWRYEGQAEKFEGILAVFAFHICQLVTYFIVPASIFKPWSVSPVLTVICLIWLVIMMKKTELPMLLASFKSPSAWQSSCSSSWLRNVAVMWATHYVKITTKDISWYFLHTVSCSRVVQVYFCSLH